MSLETIEGVNTGIGKMSSLDFEANKSRFYGFVGEPRNDKEWKYVKKVLGDHAVECLINQGRIQELKLCAYSKRVSMSPEKIFDPKERILERESGHCFANKAILREKYDKHYSFMNPAKDTKHYNLQQISRWFPDEIHCAGEIEGHSPSDEELGLFIALNPEISEQYRIWYIHLYGEQMGLDYVLGDRTSQIIREKIIEERIKNPSNLGGLTDTELSTLKFTQEKTIRKLFGQALYGDSYNMTRKKLHQTRAEIEARRLTRI